MDLAHVERVVALVKVLEVHADARDKVARQLRITRGELRYSVSRLQAEWNVKFIAPGGRRLTPAGRELALNGDILLHCRDRLVELVRFAEKTN